MTDEGIMKKEANRPAKRISIVHLQTRFFNELSKII